MNRVPSMTYDEKALASQQEQAAKQPPSRRRFLVSAAATVGLPWLESLAGRNKAAAATFEEFSPSHRKEYIEWITEARRDETRQKRLSTTLAWLAEGKSRNWKYENC